MRELFYVAPSKLTAEQIRRVTEVALSHPAEAATIFASSDAEPSVRACTVRWISDPWIQALLWPYVKAANDAGFQVDVHERAEIQFVEYSAQDGAHYDWHQDVQWYGQTGQDRKLSVTVQLSKTEDYEGGDLEFEDVQTSADFRSQGTVLVFPSYLRHRVHPVTSGIRYALVAWFFGPRWR